MTDTGKLDNERQQRIGRTALGSMARLLMLLGVDPMDLIRDVLDQYALMHPAEELLAMYNKLNISYKEAAE